jgi:hypothetical protein
MVPESLVPLEKSPSSIIKERLATVRSLANISIGAEPKRLIRVALSVEEGDR